MNKGAGLFARILSLALCATVLLCLCPSSALAADRERRRVRVGYFAFDGYHMQTPEGERSGYGYELLARLAGYTNWRYEYIGYEKSWGEMQDMLARGEIDLLTSAQKTPAREQRFDFSEQAIGHSSAILTVRAGDETYMFEDYANWDGMRVGMLLNNSRNDSFAIFAAEHGFNYAPHYYDSTEAMVAALQAGGALDAILTSNLRQISGEWIIAQFDPSPFYVMVRKGDAELLRQVDNAIAQLLNTEPELSRQLMNKYYSPTSGEELALTVQERAFIKANRDVAFTALLNPAREPYSYLKDGQPTGLFYGVAMEIIQRAGLRVRFVKADSRAEYGRLLQSGEVDLRFDAACNYAQAEDSDTRLTVSYLEVPTARLYRRGARAGSTAALLRNGDVATLYAQRLAGEGLTLAYYDSTEELVEAVLSGKQDMAYLADGSADLAVHRELSNRLLAEELHGMNVQYCIAVNANADPLLYSVLNKAAASLWETEISALSRQYTSFEQEPFSIVRYTYDYPVHVMLFVATALLVLYLAVAARRASRARALEAAKRLEEERRSALLADALSSAENADAAKSQFLSRVSHEMRTPLNAIIGFLDLSRGVPPQQASVYLANAQLAAKQLLAVINDVLDMSSIESGKLQIAHTAFDLKQLLRSITDIYLAQCQQKGLAYETKIFTPIDEWLVGDQLRVNQILINLLGNALKFTASGHIWLTVSQHNDAREDRVFLRFVIADSGSGMSEDMLERLFRPFEQESVRTAQKFGGSGLGLSIVKNLVTMMDGAIRVQSRLGEGTTFTVDLPFARSRLGHELQLPEGVEQLNVLAVDDEEAERQYLSIVLSRLELRHRCVADGNEALAELIRAEEAGEPYNVCLLDWRMPNMDGLETTRRIRERYGSQPIVIVVSAYDHNQAGEGAKEAGANLFIAKPLFQSTLFDLFMTLTGGQLVKKNQPGPVLDLSGHRVLLAEDNAMNRVVATGLVERLGVDCESAEDGQEALERFLASPAGWYDAILMDIQMPRMDGYEAAAAIRASQHPDAQSVQIIALTANAFNEDIAKTLSAGMNAHVAKPIEPNLLAAALGKAFAAQG